MGTNLAYDMLCEPSSSDNEEKDGDYLSSNRLINMKLLATNKYIFFCEPTVCTWEGCKNEIRRGKRPGKNYLLC